MSGRLDRAGLLRAAAGGVVLAATGGRAAAATRKRLLGPKDVRLVGAFRLPATVEGLDAAWGQGLALRRVAGRARFLSLAVRGEVYEVDHPGLATSPPYPEARLRRLWGDISKGHRTLDPPEGRLSAMLGLYWDDPTDTLFWTYGDGYNATSAHDPFIGVSRLDERSGRAVSFGPWRLRGRSTKMAFGGILPVPKAFARRWLGGRRLAAGFGGYFSIATVGPVSMGPALAAFSPDDLPAAGGGAPMTPLLGYPFNAEPYTAPFRARRDPGYRTEFDGWAPRDGVGWWSWTDQLGQGGVWVDTPAVEGVLFLPTMGVGRTWYETSTLHAENAAHWWFVYDPADLARVASGRARQWEIQPARSWRVRVPGLPDPLPGWADGPGTPVTGSVFDPVTSRIYVAVRFGAGTGSGHLVLAYEVARR